MTTNNTAVAMTATLSMEQFSAYLNSPLQEIDIDLSNATLIDVIKHCQAFKRKTNPSYTMQEIIYNLERFEEAFHAVIMPVKVNDIFNSFFAEFLVNRGLTGSTIKTYFNKLVYALKWGALHRCPLSATFSQFVAPKYKGAHYALSADDVSFIYHFDFAALRKTVKRKVKRTVEVSMWKNLYKGKNRSRKNVIGRKEYVSKRVVEFEEEVDVPLLSAQQVETMNRVRDQFCLGCNLMQRYSDMSRIEPSCFNESKTVFKIVQQKTGNKAVVNIKEICIDPSMTRDILERYGYRSPFGGSINRFNKYLHEMLKLIGGKFLTESVKCENKVCGEIVINETPLWEAIASHTARRTGITYNVLRGVPEAKIRIASGHQDSRSFCRYIIVKDDE